MNPIVPFRLEHSWRMRAFTLIELLVVISIIGILAAMVAPAISNMRKGDIMSAGVRQLLDDVAYARQRAINDHTTVYVVFIPPAVGAQPAWFGALTVDEKRQFLEQQMGSYALFVKRQAGDQPGRGTHRYITSWRSLPEGIVIAPEKYFPIGGPRGLVPSLTGSYLSFDYPVLINGKWDPEFPFPNTNRPVAPLPYLEFDYTGTLKSGGNGITSVIPLSRGSLQVNRSAWAPPDYREVPPGNSTNAYNQIVIDRLTGRARHETRRIQ